MQVEAEIAAGLWVDVPGTLALRMLTYADVC
jgi:hypothetical protein